MSSLIDNTASCVHVDPVSGNVRVGGALVFRIVSTPGQPLRVQFYDGNRARVEARGTPFIEVPLDVLVSKLENMGS